MARQLDGDKREKILEAARTIFGEHGYQQTTVKQIADSAGIAPGTLYTYFENKDELFTAAVDEVWRRFVTGLKSISLTNEPFIETLGAFIDVGFGLIKEIHPLLRGMFSEANRREMLLERMDEFCGFIAGYFEDARSRGMMIGPAGSEEIRMFNLRMIVSGVLFRASLTPPCSLSDELELVKRGLVAVISDRMRKA